MLSGSKQGWLCGGVNIYVYMIAMADIRYWYCTAALVLCTLARTAAGSVTTQAQGQAQTRLPPPLLLLALLLLALLLLPSHS